MYFLEAMYCTFSLLEQIIPRQIKSQNIAISLCAMVMPINHTQMSTQAHRTPPQVDSGDTWLLIQSLRFYDSTRQSKSYHIIVQNTNLHQETPNTELSVITRHALHRKCDTISQRTNELCCGASSFKGDVSG